VRPSWALEPGLTDRLVVGRNVTLTWQFSDGLSYWIQLLVMELVIIMKSLVMETI
jgi:hypothetical protein